MKYASYLTSEGSPTWGIAHDDRLYDLGPSGKNLARSLKEAVVDRVFGTVVEFMDAPSQPEEATRFLPLIDSPGKILCIGVNYRAHQAETGRPDAPAPTVFTRFADSQMGHGQAAIKPTASTQFDYEGELALVIGREAYRVRREEAADHVAGYGIYNDFSVRDWQRATTQWIPGKNFADTGAFGPYLVPAANLGDISRRTLETRVNGKVRQHADLDDLIFDIPAIIEYCSAFTRLSPGDVIVTGTPGGVGLFMDPPGLLAAGDVVEVEITGLGLLRNVVRDEGVPGRPAPSLRTPLAAAHAAE